MTYAIPTAGRTNPTHAGAFWFESFLVFLVFLVAAGEPAPGVNEAHYLCRLKHYWDPAGYCPGDLFLESPEAHFTVVWLLGWVTRFLSLDATAWLGRVLAWGLLAVGWRRLVGRVTPVGLLAPLAAAGLCAATREGNLAGEWIVGGFESKPLAYGLVLFALADALDGRWRRVAVLLGAAIGLHALVGGWSFVALGGAVLLCVRPLPSPRGLVSAGVAGGGLALLGIAPALALGAGVWSDVVSAANEVYVYYRLPHHLALWSMPPEWLAERAARHGVVLAALALATLFARRWGSPGVRLLVAFAWVAEATSAAGLAIGLVGREDPAWAASLLKYYWHRLADVAAPLAALAAASQWLGRALRDRRPAGAIALAAALAASAAYLAGIAAERVRNPVAAGDAVMADPPAWIEMCDWVRRNTPPDTLFLTPRRAHSFKWRAERAEVVTQKDIPQDAVGMVEWRRRMDRVFLDDRGAVTPDFARLGAGRLRELAAEFGADYALDQARNSDTAIPSRRRASLPVVHRVGPYTLYDLRKAGEP